MRKWVVAGMVTIAAFNMVGCTPGNNVPGATATGAVAGGLIGNELFHGRNAFAGVIAGALVGGLIGNQVGEYMDRQDRINMQSAIINTPVNQQATWTSDHPGPNGQRVTYTVRPVRNYYTPRRHLYCREYQTTVIIGGQPKRAFGKACRMPDGSWKMH